MHGTDGRRSRRTGWIAAAVAAAVGAAALASGANAAVPAAWKTYCAKQGGTVQMRTAAAGTNSPPLLKLGPPVAFCRWHQASDDSQILVDLRTLTTRKPTLAAIAYLARVQPGRFNPNANPASQYCTKLGGTDLFGGVNIAGGGWVLRSNANSAVDMCTFPDGSIIDSFGILYASQGAVRGADLTRKFRYRPGSRLPAVFG
ncbi:MAG: hypothetical protein AB7V62_13640 [Thermoleophilia bacterium]